MIKQLKNRLNLFMAGNALAATMALTPYAAYAQTNEGTGEEISTTEDGTGEGSGMFDSSYTPNQPTSQPTEVPTETPEAPVCMPADTLEFLVTNAQTVRRGILSGNDIDISVVDSFNGLNFGDNSTVQGAGHSNSNYGVNTQSGQNTQGDVNCAGRDVAVSPADISALERDLRELRDLYRQASVDIEGLRADQEAYAVWQTQVNTLLDSVVGKIGIIHTTLEEHSSLLEEHSSVLGSLGERLTDYENLVGETRDGLANIEDAVVGLNLSPALGGLVSYDGEASARFGLEFGLSPYSSAWNFTLGGAANLGLDVTSSETTAHPAETTNYNNGSHTVHTGSSTERTTEQTVAAARVGVGYEISDNLTVGAALEAQFRGTDTATSETSVNEIYNRAGELQSVHQVAADERLGADSYDVVFNPGAFLQYNVEGLGLRLDAGFQDAGLTIQYDLLDN